MDRVLLFLSSSGGRWANLLVGAAMIVVGLGTGTTASWIVAAFGVLPVAAAALDVCPPALLVGLPMSGPELRERLGVPREAPLIGGSVPTPPRPEP